MTKSPSVIEFKETVRNAFEYLGREFAFQEVEPPAKDLEMNPFLIWFVNATTLVQVEGISWGFAAQVILGPANAGNRWSATVPLWAIIKHRRPDLYEQVATSAGQLGEMRTYAHALHETASDVLRGNFAVFAAARAIVAAEWIQQRIGQGEETRERDYRAAVTDAAVAFRARDFQRVVDLLMRHVGRLTQANRAKLDYARARIDRSGTAV